MFYVLDLVCLTSLIANLELCTDDHEKTDIFDMLRESDCTEKKISVREKKINSFINFLKILTCFIDKC